MDENQPGILEFFDRYLSDKGVNGYAPIYDELFYPRKNYPVKLLEIGIGTLNNTNSNMIFWKVNHQKYLPGASLRAFRDYFQNGLIYGVDIQPDCIFFEERIHTFLFDSRIKEMCDSFLFGLTFDIIIDDGDHHFESQIRTFENLFGKLNKYGIYILEDLAFPNEIKEYFKNTSYNYEFFDSPGLVVIKNFF